MKKRKIILNLIILLAISYLLFAIPVSAVSLLPSSIVPCGIGPTTLADGKINPGFKACTVCDFFVLAQNIINLFLYITAPLVTIAAVYIAFLFMFSGGSSSTISDAKSKLGLVVLGVAWVLGSWLVLNSILNIVAKPGVFPWPVWNKIECKASPVPASTVGSPSVDLPGGSDKSPYEGGSSGGGGATRGWGLSEKEARDALQEAGITIYKNKSACPDGVRYQNVSGGCTSLVGTEESTVTKAIALKQDCKCSIVITGGTELGHAPGTLSHESGNKLDFLPNPALDSFIQKNYTDIGYRSDGAKQYKTANGSIFAKEGDHWDVTFLK